MALPRKPSFYLLTLGACILVLAAILIALRQGTPAAPPVGAATGANGDSDGFARAGNPTRSREKRPIRGGSAPAASASEAVAALVGDDSLSDPEVVAGLRRIVEDAGRPLAERLEALDHALHLAPNDPPDVLQQMAARPVQPEEVRKRLLEEALNRPPRLQGEILVLLLQHAAGDLRTEILSELTALVGEDLGEDAAAWRAAVDKLPGEP